jgi:MerR family transcriptional regulator, light-induced transcriptional regulator
MNYTVKAAARATGISESRLRTWERRYGIPSPRRAPTGRRLYDEDDLNVIRRMAGLLNAGMSAAQAAEAAKSGNPELQAPERLENDLVGVIALAAAEYDETSAVNAIRRAVQELSWPEALDEVLFPVLRRVGFYWQGAVVPPATEHFTSELVRQELMAAISKLTVSQDSMSILLACPEAERHDIGLLALSLLLRMAGIRSLYLGADVPTSDILEVYDVAKPNAICLSATTGEGLASLIRASRLIVAGRRRVTLFLGGPSLQAGTDASGILLPATIRAATDAIVESLGRQAI